MLALTKNQAHLYDQVTEMFTYERNTDFRNCPQNFHQTVEKGHGCLEARRRGAVADPEYVKYVKDDQIGHHLQGLGMVESARRLPEKTTRVVQYFISSLPPKAPALRGEPVGRKLRVLGHGCRLPGERQPHPPWPSKYGAPLGLPATPRPQSAAPGDLSQVGYRRQTQTFRLGHGLSLQSPSPIRSNCLGYPMSSSRWTPFRMRHANRYGLTGRLIREGLP